MTDDASPPRGRSRHRSEPSWEQPVSWRERLGDGLRDQALTPGARRALLLLLGAGVLLGLVYLWLARPTTEPAPPLQRSTAVTLATPSAATAQPLTSPSPTAPPVVVDVVGAVRRPGVVELPPGSRVRDAVEAAGGATGRARLASVNLARLLVDGEQLVVLRRGEDGLAAAGAVGAGPPAAGAPSAGAAGALPGAPIDLNSATAEQLDALPGIGPVLAARIIDWRAQHGRFDSVDELTQVSGIGEATFADLRDLVRV